MSVEGGTARQTIDGRQPSAVPESPGWFGKIAGLGDFARRRLPEHVAQALDDWLAQAIASSRATLGDRWQDLYLTSPLWRFALAPECIDASWWFGVLMPSCDNVGRYFPLIVVQSSREAPATLAALANLEAWFAVVGDAALGTLQAGGSLERFEASLSRLALIPGPAGPLVRIAELDDRTRQEVMLADGLAGLLQGFVASTILHAARGRSFWWPLRPDAATTSLSITTGLPDGDSFVRMIEGTW